MTTTLMIVKALAQMTGMTEEEAAKQLAEVLGKEKSRGCHRDQLTPHEG